MDAKDKGELDPRSQQIADRKQRMRELNPPPPRVRVTPRDDDMRRVLRHPNGAKFPESGSVEWPLDQFTRRRLKDGSVTREERRDEGGEHRRRASSEPKPAA